MIVVLDRGRRGRGGEGMQRWRRRRAMQNFILHLFTRAGLYFTISAFWFSFDSLDVLPALQGALIINIFTSHQKISKKIQHLLTLQQYCKIGQVMRFKGQHRPCRSVKITNCLEKCYGGSMYRRLLTEFTRATMLGTFKGPQSATSSTYPSLHFESKGKQMLAISRNTRSATWGTPNC